jgi:nicotinate phosphoribosyltransferase
LTDADVEKLRRGYFADPPYANIVELLESPQLSDTGERDIAVETHWIPRRRPFTVTAGIPRVLEIFKTAAGHWTPARRFREANDSLQIWAIPDGEIVQGAALPLDATPALVVKGRYRDFAHLKTPALGTLARASRIATNTHRLLEAAGGKPVYTFSARYDPHELQELDGYAYEVGVNSYRRKHNVPWPTVVSTQANTTHTHATVLGTLSHEAIACFGGDGSALMRAFCEAMPIERLRVALLDFNNDCVGEAKAVLTSLFARRREVRKNGGEFADRYRLDGVRLDTSAELLDQSLATRLGEARGVSAELVRLVRDNIDHAWEDWALSEREIEDARTWCSRVKIIVSGGFNEDRIWAFESAAVPVDAYGVGTALLSNSAVEQSVTDFSAGVVAIKRDGAWQSIAKAGRRANWDSRLQLINVSGEGR